MKIIVDTNVVLDVLLDREPFVNASLKIFSLVEQSIINAFLFATTITTIDYLLNQSLPKPKAMEALHSLIGMFEIATVNRSVIERALVSKINDFEDAVLHESGILAGVDCIITRNVKDFTKAELRVFEPTEFLSQLSK